MGIELPGAGELLIGTFAVVLIPVLAAVMVVWDLRGRAITAWWAAGLLTLLILPVGLVAWVALRSGWGRSTKAKNRTVVG